MSTLSIPLLTGLTKKKVVLMGVTYNLRKTYLDLKMSGGVGGGRLTVI